MANRHYGPEEEAASAAEIAGAVKFTEAHLLEDLTVMRIVPVE